MIELWQKIEGKSARILVVGLGYVGLPVACLFADAGYRVVGIRRNSEKVEQINAGILPLEGEEPGLPDLLARVVATGRLHASTDFAHCREADVVLVAVETPVDPSSKLPDYRVLRAALQSLADNLVPGCLVVIESTIAPGTMYGLVKPLLEERSGLKAGKDFLLANCPERVMPGKLLHNLQHCSRVIGVADHDTERAALALYQQIVSADLDCVSWLAAEIVKTAENAYRDVQIAFANELALLCESVGADVWQVRELVNKSPGRHMLLPGGGVGGHCIPKDPWLLVAGGGEGFVPRLVPAARAINDGMPGHVADLISHALADAGKPLRGARVAVLGFAYLENSDDTRNSPSDTLVRLLRSQGVDVVVHDPFLREYSGPIEQALQQADCAVLMVAHGCYKTLVPAFFGTLMRTPVVVDARRILDPLVMTGSSVRYVCLGDGAGHRA